MTVDEADTTDATTRSSLRVVGPRPGLLRRVLALVLTGTLAIVSGAVLDTARVIAASGNLLMVTPDGSFANGDDAAKKALFESFGWAVTAIDDSSSGAAFVTAAASNDVLFASDTVTDPNMKVNVRDLAIGLVVEKFGPKAEIMYGATPNESFASETSIRITDNTHYITSPFAAGALPIYSSVSDVNYWQSATTALPAGVVSLADRTADADNETIYIAEAGATLFSANTAPDRRVFVPSDSAGVANWTSDYETIIERSLDWAAGLDNVVTVNSTGDAPDASFGDGRCDTGAAVAGGAAECTLRAAIQEANASADVDTVHFGIPDSDSGYVAGPPERWVIQPASSHFGAISGVVLLDATTQPGWTGDPVIQLDGSLRSGTDDGIHAAAAGMIVRGLSLTNWPDDAGHTDFDGVVWESNWFGVAPDGTVGASGTSDLQIYGAAANVTVGGASAGQGNRFGAGGTEDAIRVDGFANGTTVTNNVFGIGPDGAADLGAFREAINLTDAIDTTIADNRFGHFPNAAIVLEGGSTGTTVIRNEFGVDELGGPAPVDQAIWHNATGSVTFGGIGDGNTVTNSASHGVVAAASATGTMTLLSNSIWANGGIAFDLGGDAVTANDAGDGDTGPNDLLNFPVVTEASELTGTVTVDFTLDAPAGDYRIEAFVNPSGADPSGYGEGELLATAASVTHTGGGVEPFQLTYPGAAGDLVALTATEDLGAGSYGATSEYSLTRLTVALVVCVTDSDGDGLCDGEEDANIDADDDPATNPGPDTDGDTTPNFLDADDDGDGVSTATEGADPNADGSPRDAIDSDRDGQPDFLDPDVVLPSTTPIASEQKISDIAGGFTATLDDNDAIGRSVAAIGDIDGDGIGDLAIGVPADDDLNQDNGAVYIAFLNADGSVRAHQKISALEGGVAGPWGAFDGFGRSVTSVGDLDGDLVNDIAVGAPRDDDGSTDNGAIYVLFLDTDGTVRTQQKISSTAGGLTGPLDAGGNFGESVTNLGDVDGDGVNDLFVGASESDDGGTRRGAGWVLFLDTDGTVKSEQKISSTVGGFTGTLSDADLFGRNAAGLGDVDGDGTPDLAVAAPRDDVDFSDTGSVWVLFLNPDGSVKAEQQIGYGLGGFAGHPGQLAEFGSGVGGLGDIDGDGINDLAVGAHQAAGGGSWRGTVFLLSLNSDGTVKSEAEISSAVGGLTGPIDDDDDLGSAVAGLGDLDGDGALNLAIGAKLDDDGGTNRGAVYIVDLTVDSIVTVNSTGDGGDSNPGDGSCDTGLPNSEGADECTLRAAIEEANASATIDTIHVDIPVGDGGHAAGVWTIAVGSKLPATTAPVVLDATTHPDFVDAPIVAIDGGNSVLTGLDIDGGASEVRGFVIHSFTDEGIDLDIAGGNTIAGNWIGLLPDGTTAAGNGDDGVAIRAASTGNTIGGSTALDRNVVSANAGEGVYVLNSSGNIVEGNYLGTDVTGLLDRGNGDEGLDLDGANGNTIVGNVISGNDGEGVQIRSSDDNAFTANLIGVGADGTTPIGNKGDGVTLNFGDSVGVRFGGTGATDGNVIAYNGDEGVSIFGATTDDVWSLGNSIHSNAALGWDFEGDGVTPNDAGDADGGVNDFMNFPVITGLAVGGGTVDVDFDLDLTAGTYRIEFFDNPLGADPSGYGEGYAFASATTIVHTGSGVESFSHSWSGSASVLTATTTEEFGGGAYGSTSEFSAAFGSVAPVANDDPGDVPTEIAERSPLSYYRLGEASGLVAADQGSLGNDGTYTNGVPLGAAGPLVGDADTAASFDGIDDFVEIAHDDAYLVDSGAVSLWIWPDDLSVTRSPISKDSTSVDDGGHFLIEIGSSGDVRYRLQDVGGDHDANSATGLVTPGQWHHVVATFGPLGMQLWLDGELIATNPYLGGLGASSGGGGNLEPWVIGASTANSDDLLATPVRDEFAGLIDEVAVFGTQLDHADVAALYGAAAQRYQTPAGTLFTTTAENGVLANDSDLEDDALTAVLVTGPSAAATFTLNADGSFSYESNPGFSGTDTFTYLVDDGTGQSAPATVSIVVTLVETTMTVNSTGDGVDIVPGDGVCDTGADNSALETECTLRAAIEEANASAAVTTIEFAIPTTESGHDAAGFWTIAVATQLPTVTDTVLIDGTSQPEWLDDPIIELRDGANVSNGLVLAAADIVVRGLSVTGFFDGVEIGSLADDAVIEHSWFGVRPSGLVSTNSYGVYVVAGAERASIGSPGAGNVVISSSDGLRVHGAGAVVQANRIGITEAGGTYTAARRGVAVYASGVTIGGVGVGEGNIITAALGSGTLPGTGVYVPSADDVTILGNRIDGNRFNIDLGGDRATPNDPLDADTGANQLLNHPTLAVTNSSTADFVTWTVDVDVALDVPAGDYRIEIFDADAPGFGGGGEASELVHAFTVSHPGGGVQTFSTSYSGPEPRSLTSTATEDLGGGTYGATSELSPALGAASGPFTVNSTGNLGDADLGDGICSTGGFNSESVVECTLRAAIEQANRGSEITVEFAIPSSDDGYDAAGFWTIQQSGDFEHVRADGTVIDASTQPEFVADPVIFVRDDGAGTNTFTLHGHDVVLRGLSIDNPGDEPVEFDGDRQVVDQVWIGIDPTGVVGGSPSSTKEGIIIYDGTEDAVVSNSRVAGFDSGIVSNSGTIDITITGTEIFQNRNGGAVFNNSGRMTLLGNSIHDNEGLGIELGSNDGVPLPNDLGDADSGANDLLNYPVVSGVVLGSGSADITYELDVPAGTYRVEFFDNDAADPSGYGEGQTFLDADTVVHAGGTVSYTHTVTAAPGDVVTLTATPDLGAGAYGGTSEFSLAVEVGTVVVNSTGDAVDLVPGDGVCDTGGLNSEGSSECTLRAAIEEANANVDVARIAFDIPNSDPNHLYHRDDAAASSLGTPVVTALDDAAITDFDPDYPVDPFSWWNIQVTGNLPDVNGGMTIDGTTQPGWRPNTATGGAARDAILPIVVTSDGTYIMDLRGSGSVVRGVNFSSAGASGTMLFVAGSGSHTVEGSWFMVDPVGVANGAGDDGIWVTTLTSNVTIGGPDPADHVLIGNGFSNSGLAVISDSTTVENVWIGSQVTGDALLPGYNDISLYVSGNDNIVRDVVVSSSLNDILTVQGDRNTVQGGAFGLLPDGTVSDNEWATIVGNDNLIGGVGLGAGNAFGSGDSTSGASVYVSGGTGNSLLGNTYVGSRTTPIEIAPNGVNANDAGDADVGDNDLLNHPVISGVAASGGSITVDYELDVPAGDYRIEFYADVTEPRNPSGYGAGEVLLGSAAITHTGTGVESFQATVTDPGDLWLAATATEDLGGGDYGSTSEFGPNVCSGDTDGDGLCDVWETAYGDTDGDTLPNWNDPDDDGDGTPTASENPDPNTDGDPRDARDTDRDGQPDWLDIEAGPSITLIADEQKISSTQGGLVGPLDDLDHLAKVASIGDLDGDGVNDLIAGSLYDDDGGTDRGAVYILFLNADGTVKAEQKISSTQGGLTGPLDDGDLFGISVAGIGDLDGDAVLDVAVGVFDDDDGGSNRGAVYILFLNPDGTVKAEQKISSTQGGLTGPLDNDDQFGVAVGEIGDLDGDGLPDLAVGAFTDDDGVADGGAVYILMLDADGTVKAEQKISSTAGGLTGPLDNGDYFGANVTGIGDLDADGVEDLAVGAVFDDDGVTDGGAVYILFLDADGTVKAEQKVSATQGGLTPLDASDHFGSGVGAVGDIDGDSLPDIAVGAWLDDDGGADRGAVYLLALNSDGTVRTEQKISSTVGGLSGPLGDNDRFGSDIAGLGDLDGDGTLNVAVTARLDDDGGTDRGAVYVLDLSPDPVARVNSTGDGSDLAPGDGHCSTGGAAADGRTECTLRAAIEEANASAVIDTIEFEIPTADGGHAAGVWTIAPATAYPSIVGPLSLDGSTQSGAQCAANGEHTIAVQLTGRLVVTGAGSTISGISIDGATGTALSLVGNGNTVRCSFLGVGADGVTASGLVGTAVLVDGDDNVVGGATDADRNVLSTGGDTGIVVETGASRTLIERNHVGTDVTGTLAVSNFSSGISLSSDVDTTIRDNLISASWDGVFASGSSGLHIDANRFGTDITGSTAIANGGHGVSLLSGADAVLITDNVISGSGGFGLLTSNSVGTVTVTGNLIGVNAAGDASIPNADGGIYIQSPTVVGGAGATDGNTISGNGGDGVTFSPSSAGGSSLIGNRIGSDVTGTTAIPNGGVGVLVWDADGVVIGGAGADDGNVIAGNVSHGVEMRRPAGGEIRGNRIGIGADGSALGNGGDGVAVTSGASDVTIVDNVIADNGGLGIDLGGDGVTSNDAGDADTGDNGLLNFPVITAASELVPGIIGVSYTLDVPIDVDGYRVDFFLNPSGADASGYGEAEVLLGSEDRAGSGSFVFQYAGSVGDVVTATVTAKTAAAFAATSEFSATYTVSDGIVIVNSTGDAGDSFPGNGACDTGGVNSEGAVECTLRAAIEEANAAVDVDAVHFAIPESDDGHAAGVWTIAPATALPNVTDTLAIDGATQPGTVVNTAAAPLPLNGAPAVELVGSWDIGDGLHFAPAAAGSSVNGLVIGGFSGSGDHGIEVDADDVTVTGTYVGVRADGATNNGNAYGIYVSGARTTIGGTEPADRNLVAGENNAQILIDGGVDTVVLGNVLGADASTSFVVGTWGSGVQAWNGSGLVLGSSAAPNVIGAAPGEWGIEMGITGTIEGNLFGTDVTYTADLGSWQAMSIGANGPVTVRGNVIGNWDEGIRIGQDDVTVVGNWIGTDPTAAVDLGNASWGVTVGLSFRAVTNVMIGGTAPDDGNVIAHNGGDGVVVVNGASVATIIGNAIVDNGGLGIDLGDDALTTNDAGDADIGANGLLNFPVLTSSTSLAGGGAMVDVVLDVPAGSYRIEFFDNTSGADPSGYGEGEQVIGAQQITHAGGSVAYALTVDAAAGDVITATLTPDLGGGAFGGTSEFSNAITVAVGGGTVTDLSERRSDLDAVGGADVSVANAGVVAGGIDLAGGHERLVGPVTEITSGALTLSGWVNAASLTGDAHLISKQPAGGGAIYELLADGATGEAVARLTVGGASVEARGGAVGTGGWQQLAATWDGTFLSLYVDGAWVDTVGAIGSLGSSVSAPLVVGNDATASGGLVGSIDQIQIARVARTPGWIETEYNNLSNPTAMVSIGAAQTNAPDAWSASATVVRSGSHALSAPEITAGDADGWAVATGIDEPGVVYEAWWYLTDPSVSEAAAGTNTGLAPTDQREAAATGAGIDLAARAGASVSVDATSPTTIPAAAWTHVEVRTDETGTSSVWIAGSQIIGPTLQALGASGGSVGLRSGALPAGQSWYVDDVRVRRFVSDEPATTLGPIDRR